MNGTAKATVMEGSLLDFSLADILQVLSVSPESTRIELQTEDRSFAGAIIVKNGKILQSVAGEDRGSDAFFRLFQQRLGFFRAFREEHDATPEPVGSVRELLLEATGIALAQEEVTHRSLGPRPSPASQRRRPFPLPPPSRSPRPRSDPTAAS